MSTSITEHAAATERTGRRSVVRLVLGSLVLLVALTIVAATIAGIVGLERDRDASGYFVTHSHHYGTSSYALSTESLNVGSITGALETRLLRLRLSATSSHERKPLFIGIARTEDVARYLAHVQHDELRDIRFDPFRIAYRRVGSGAPAARPSTRAFWQTHASGSGTQTISWPVRSGQWSAVVMNADGSRNVSIDGRLAVRLAGAWWFVGGFLVLGALSLAAGIALLRTGSGRGGVEAAAPTG